MDWHKVTFFKELLAFGVLTWKNKLCTIVELPSSYDTVFTFWYTEEPAVLLNREHPAFCKRKFRNWYRMDSSIILDDWAELWEYLVLSSMSRQSFESRFLNHFLETKKCTKLMSCLGTTVNVWENCVGVRRLLLLQISYFGAVTLKSWVRFHSLKWKYR